MRPKSLKIGDVYTVMMYFITSMLFGPIISEEPDYTGDSSVWKDVVCKMVSVEDVVGSYQLTCMNLWTCFGEVLSFLLHSREFGGSYIWWIVLNQCGN